MNLLLVRSKEQPEVIGGGEFDDGEHMTRFFLLYLQRPKLAAALGFRLSRLGTPRLRAIAYTRFRMASTAPAGKEVPQGFVLHSENSSHILLDANAAFLNPVQEFNRDLSVACIRTWSDETNKAKELKWKQKQERRQKAPAAKRVKGAFLCYGCVIKAE